MRTRKLAKIVAKPNRVSVGLEKSAIRRVFSISRACFLAMLRIHTTVNCPSYFLPVVSPTASKSKTASFLGRSI